MMSGYNTIHIRVSNAVIKQISMLANHEGRELGEMAGILLEDALALRETINSSVLSDRPSLGTHLKSPNQTMSKRKKIEPNPSSPRYLKTEP